MASELGQSQFDDCLALYLHTWELLDDQAFTSAEVVERLVNHDRNIEYITQEDEPERHLNLLVAYGLLDRMDDGRYRIRCAPDDDLESWQERQAIRTEAIYQYVQRQQADRPMTGERSDHLQRHGATFTDVFIDAEIGFAELIAQIAASMEDTSDIDGVVLRAPAELTGHVQQLADDLCDREGTDDADRGPFEKITADVVGEHKDDLEYRLYLREAR